MKHSQSKLETLVQLFNQLFLKTENTRLQIGAQEPFYQAATEQSESIIFSREDYFSSALHEIAHWCIAGFERRKIDDFGYWYKPEGRSYDEQLEFEKVEIKPQAVEWALSLACDHLFHFSADNISQGIDASEQFKNHVTEQLKSYLRDDSLPPRAALLYYRLLQVFRNNRKVELSNV